MGACRWERFLWMGGLCITESGWALILILAWAKMFSYLWATITSMKGSSGCEAGNRPGTFMGTGFMISIEGACSEMSFVGMSTAGLSTEE